MTNKDMNEKTRRRLERVYRGLRKLHSTVLAQAIAEQNEEETSKPIETNRLKNPTEVLMELTYWIAILEEIAEREH